MSEKEKKILEAIAEVLPEMSDTAKERWLGQAEGMAMMKRMMDEKRSKTIEIDSENNAVPV